MINNLNQIPNQKHQAARSAVTMVAEGVVHLKQQAPTLIILRTVALN